MNSNPSLLVKGLWWLAQVAVLSASQWLIPGAQSWMYLLASALCGLVWVRTWRWWYTSASEIASVGLFFGLHQESVADISKEMGLILGGQPNWVFPAVVTIVCTITTTLLATLVRSFLPISKEEAVIE